MSLSDHWPDNSLRWIHRAVCALVLIFLLMPILIIVPLSFNAEPYFTFTEGMLRMDAEAWSLRWYKNVLTDANWQLSLINSLGIGIVSTLLATILGTLAALGITHAAVSSTARTWLMGFLVSPMITPIIITASGMFFFYSNFGLAQTHLGIILAHTALSTPFVVITVVATLLGFDFGLMRAAASLGAGALVSFWRVQLPLILPGIMSGAIFAFSLSFDELVVVLFMGGLDQRTIPRQMWAGIREQISPAILVVATFLILFTVLLMLVVEWLRRRSAADR